MWLYCDAHSVYVQYQMVSQQNHTPGYITLTYNQYINEYTQVDLR
jgi:hypothetical protein